MDTLELIENQLKQAISIVHHLKHTQKENFSDLKSLLIETLDLLENSNYDDCDSDSDSDSDEDSLCDSDSDTDSDASFTKDELLFIKNESHRNYLKKYSLKPKFPLHYLKEQ